MSLGKPILEPLAVLWLCNRSFPSPVCLLSMLQTIYVPNLGILKPLAKNSVSDKPYIASRTSSKLRQQSWPMRWKPTYLICSCEPHGSTGSLGFATA
jgi:hypothetical protein